MKEEAILKRLDAIEAKLDRIEKSRRIRDVYGISLEKWELLQKKKEDREKKGLLHLCPVCEARPAEHYGICSFCEYSQ